MVLPKPDPKVHIFDPDRAVDTTLEFVHDRMGNPTIGINPMLPGLSDKLDPWVAGDLIGFLGYTSNGKSSMASYVVNQHGNRLAAYQKEHPDYNHVIVYFTWEQPIEQQTAVDFSRASKISVSDILHGKITENQFKNLQTVGEQRKTLPIWLVGHSIKEDRTKPMLNMDEVNQILMTIEGERGMVVDLVVLDYLQRIRRMRPDIREGYMQICDDARSMALKSPVLLLSQAKREILKSSWPAPTISDAQETSNYEQSCTHMFGFMMPKQGKYKDMTINGVLYNIESMDKKLLDHMLVMSVLKQTLGPATFDIVYELGFGGTYLREWGEPEPIEDRLGKLL